MNGIIREHIIKRFYRSKEWHKVRKEFIRSHPECYVCGRTTNLHVHHIVPYHIDPSKELDPDNLITLCGRCHLLIGHLNCWNCWNPNIIDDANYLKQKILLRECDK